MISRLKNIFKKAKIHHIPLYISVAVNKFAERFLNLHITTVSYYSPIPKIRAISQADFNKISRCPGIDWNIDHQRKNLKLFSKYTSEFTPQKNIGLSKTDAFVLYALIRETKPKKLIEIGCGESTKIILHALDKNRSEGHEGYLNGIEPHADKTLRSINSKSFNLINSQLQDVEVEFFKDADLLFIDSSHISKLGSDVNYEILEIIPELKVGALVHWHDIVMPGEYFKDWIVDHGMFWNESYLVQSFMQYNSAFKIVWASRFMQIYHADLIEENLIPQKKDPERMTSFWIQRIN